MFFKFLVEKRCSSCGKLDRSYAFISCIKDSEDVHCLCSDSKGFYYETAFWLRIIQSIALSALFIILSSAIIIVRSSGTLNIDNNSIIKSYRLSLNSMEHEKLLDQSLKVEFVGLSDQLIVKDFKTKSN